MNEFGTLVEKHLQAGSLRRADLARATAYSPSYVTNILNGLRTPTPEAVTRISVALSLSDDAATALHTAAARQHGYKTVRAPMPAVKPLVKAQGRLALTGKPAAPKTAAKAPVKAAAPKATKTAPRRSAPAARKRKA